MTTHTQKVAHTSGPWRADGRIIEAPCAYSTKDKEPLIYKIAECSPVNTEANARLIAAAPELLAALRDLLAAAGAATEDQRCDLLAEMLPAVRAALNKAQGTP